jgi:hypothetical protein
VARVLVFVYARERAGVEGEPRLVDATRRGFRGVEKNAVAVASLSAPPACVWRARDRAWLEKPSAWLIRST